ncbi:hypothetical protein G6F31_015800 [Rhizopus arrhizus]|nr:hypothetical protein G6F31_015800 [Rhizopus arrhizus]
MGERSRQFTAAPAAVAGVRLVAFQPAVRAAAGIAACGQLGFAHGAGQFGGIDAGGHGDDAVADQDQYRGDEAAEYGLRHDVAETDRGHGHHRPVHAGRNVAEAMFRPFDHVHQRASDDGDGDHREQEHQHLAPAAPQRRHQHAAFLDVAGQLEDAEHAQDAQRAHHQQALRAGDEQRQVGGQDRQQVDDAPDAHRVTQRALDHRQAKQVLGGEDDRECPFQDVQAGGPFGMQVLHAVDHHHQDAGDDHPADVLLKRLVRKEARFFVGHDVLVNQ